ncbi:MAG: GspH/FimT family protein [Oleiphilaceae bacterium]|nr:GspH/FimT family protein [Oleiphilaceae bacterium]
MHQCQGVTMVELLATLAISSILISLSLASFSAIDRHQADTAARDVLSLLNYARTEALSRQSSIFVCPSSDNKTCSRPWAKNLVVFVDQNNDQQLDQGDHLLRELSLSQHRIRWRAFGNKTALQYTPMGITNYHNGTFTLCPNNTQASLARNVIVNVGGRGYLGKDRNNNGIVETASGKDLTCP